MNDEYEIKIVSPASIAEDLEDNTEYQFTGVCTTEGFSSKPNHEGGNRITRKAKFTGEISLIKGDKTLIVGRAKESESKKTRNCIRAIQSEVERMDLDSEIFYAKVQSLLRRNMLQIYQTYKNEI